MPEAEELGRTTTGIRHQLPGALDQPTLLHQTPEVLLVQPHPGQGLDHPLQL